MSITQQHTQEQLSRAYVLAVAAQAGLNISLGGGLDYGVDATVNEVVNIPNPGAGGGTMFTDEGLTLKLQLKATANWRRSATHIHFRCDGDAYNRLAIQNMRIAAPIVLVVFCQPRTRADWLAASEDALKLTNACYWYYLTGSTTQTRKVIRIPRSQLLTPAELNGIMNRINSGGTP